MWEPPYRNRNQKGHKRTVLGNRNHLSLDGACITWGVGVRPMATPPPPHLVPRWWARPHRCPCHSCTCPSELFTATHHQEHMTSPHAHLARTGRELNPSSKTCLRNWHCHELGLHLYFKSGCWTDSYWLKADGSHPISSILLRKVVGHVRTCQ